LKVNFPKFTDLNCKGLSVSLAVYKNARKLQFRATCYRNWSVVERESQVQEFS